MKIIYYCYGGAHTSVSCASIHLGFLPMDRIPTRGEFLSVPFYDQMDNDKIGTPLYVGRDEHGHDIYIMGAANTRLFIGKAIYSYLNACHVDARGLMLVNALVELNPITSVGGFASRRLSLISPGRPMTIWGIRRSYPMLTRLVTQVKERVSMLTELS